MAVFDCAKYIKSEANISDCGRYRYTLTRKWKEDPINMAVFVGLNPSTADGLQDDPTIRSCMDFSAAYGCSGLHMVNLYAYRATDPRTLVSAYQGGEDIIGPENDHHLASVFSLLESSPVIAAWGVHKRALGMDARAKAVCALLWGDWYCLGLTKDGYPRHPLYLPKSSVLTPYKVKENS